MTYLLRLVACLFLCVSLNSFGGNTSISSFQSLGFLPGGNNNSSVSDISADGSIIVGHTNSYNGTQAFKHQNGVMTGLGALSPNENFYSEATAISADGSTIVGFSHLEPNFLGNCCAREGFIYQNGVMSGIGFLPGMTDWVSPYYPNKSIASDVSGDGSIIIGATMSSDSEGRAFIFEDGIMQDVSASNFSNRLVSITPSGDIATGESETCRGCDYMFDSFQEVFQYNNNTNSVSILGDIPGGWNSSEPTAISADGSTIVGKGSSGYIDGWEAFIFRDGVFSGIGGSMARGVSGDGSIIVGNDSDGNGVLWDSETLQMFSLENLLTESGFDFANDGWTSFFAITAISDDGSTIAGVGTRDGNREAWKAEVNYTASPVPLPAGIYLFLSGLVGLVGAKLRGRNG